METTHKFRTQHTKDIKMKSTRSVAVLAAFLLSFPMIFAQSGTAPVWNSAKAKAWFEKKEWLHGLALQPHKSIDELTFAKQYHTHALLWDSAFAFFLQHDLQALPAGKYPIVGDSVFASITENATKNFEDTQWESHRKYADIQYVIRGEEKIGVRPVAGAAVTQPYDAKGDVAHYSGVGRQYVARPGVFFIFFPTDAHRPNATTGGNKVDKKLVIKVLVTGYETK